jgi:hypothetical protein
MPRGRVQHTHLFMGEEENRLFFTTPNLVPFETQLGYLPLFENNDSDHLGLFMDVSNEI